MKVKRSELEIKIDLLEQQVNILQARIAQLEARPVAAPVIQPWSPNRPYVQPGDGTARPWDRYPNTPFIVNVS